MLNSSEILDIMNQTFMLALRVALPFLLISMILGIVVAIFQAATSINEQTLSFVPKLIAIIILLSVLGSSLLRTMQDFFTMILGLVSGVEDADFIFLYSDENERSCGV